MSIEWFLLKDKDPPLNEFVEVVFEDGYNSNPLRRAFMALCSFEGRMEWYSETVPLFENVKIKCWRPMKCDHRNRKPYAKINSFGEVEVYFKKRI